MRTVQLQSESLPTLDGFQVRIRAIQNEKAIYETTVRGDSEADFLQFRDELAQATGEPREDVEQEAAELITRERANWLKQRSPEPESVGEEPGEKEKRLPQYVGVNHTTPTAVDRPEQWGIWDLVRNRHLTNFVLLLDEDIEVQDDMESQRVFAGRLMLFGRQVPLRIAARDYADNNKLKAAIFASGGPEVVIRCRMDELRIAVSVLSQRADGVTRRQMTTNFGWTEGKDAYLVPGGRITAKGFEPVSDRAELQVDLADEEQARYLNFRVLDASELARVQRHVVEDLLQLHDRSVTYSLLGAAAAAVLQGFAQGAGRFALWLVGLTGAGKSYLAKLFMNFFGDFPVSSGRFVTWSSTPNFVQRQGYFFKDALYLVDDYKPEVIQPYQLVRVLQTYADGTARGRLKSDATANVNRPIRGLLLCTGEDVPEHNASAVARSVVIKLAQRAKDIARGTRCVEECHNYSGMMADFLRWLLSGDRGRIFTQRFQDLQQRYYGDVAGQQNDSRIATNLAILGAAFEQMAEYLADAWPEWREESQRYIEEDLVAIRTEMLGEVKEQQASEVFLSVLGELVRYGRVKIDGHTNLLAEHAEVIGRADRDHFTISTKLALAAVNDSLRKQGRTPLRLTERALLQQLREDGLLLDQANGQPLAGVNVDPTRRMRLGNAQLRGFVIRKQVLLGEQGPVDVVGGGG